MIAYPLAKVNWNSTGIVILEMKKSMKHVLILYMGDSGYRFKTKLALCFKVYLENLNAK